MCLVVIIPVSIIVFPFQTNAEALPEASLMDYCGKAINFGKHTQIMPVLLCQCIKSSCSSPYWIRE